MARKKSINDIEKQGSRLYNELFGKWDEARTSADKRRYASLMNKVFSTTQRYVGNIDRKRGMKIGSWTSSLANPNKKYSQSTYMSNSNG